MATPNHTVAQVEQRFRFHKLVPVAFLGCATLSAVAGYVEQLASKGPAIQQEALLVHTGHESFPGFAYEQPPLAAADVRQILRYQSDIATADSRRDLCLNIAVKLTEIALICSAATAIRQKHEAELPILPLDG